METNNMNLREFFEKEKVFGRNDYCKILGHFGMKYGEGCYADEDILLETVNDEATWKDWLDRYEQLYSTEQPASNAEETARLKSNVEEIARLNLSKFVVKGEEDPLEAIYLKPLQQTCTRCSKMYEVEHFSRFITYKPENGICWDCFKKYLVQRDLTIEEQDWLVDCYMREQDRLDRFHGGVSTGEPMLPDYLNDTQKELIRTLGKARITAKMIDKENAIVEEAVEKVRTFCEKAGYDGIDPRLLKVLGMIVRDYESQLSSKASRSVVYR